MRKAQDSQQKRRRRDIYCLGSPEKKGKDFKLKGGSLIITLRGGAGREVRAREVARVMPGKLNEGS